MQCGSGRGKNDEYRKYECLNPIMRCSSGKAYGSIAGPPPPLHGAIHAAAIQPPQQRVGVICIPSIFFVAYAGLFLSTSYWSFQDAGKHDEGQLWKTELKLYKAVIDTEFRPLLYATVHLKALLCFGSSPFFPEGGGIAISRCWYKKMPEPVLI